jgi:putative transposase
MVREKPEALAVPRALNEVWSMDFMHDQLSDGRGVRLFNVIDDSIARRWPLTWTFPCRPFE